MKQAKNSIQQYDDLLESSKELNEELQKKSNQISSMSLHIMTVNNLVEDFVKKATFDHQDGNKIKSQINQFHRELKNIKRSLEPIKFCLSNINPDLYERIEKQYPNISQQDLKLLTFLKMNLTNKEISNMTNVTTGAVFQSKRRLKKKLGLGPEEKLNKLLEIF